MARKELRSGSLQEKITNLLQENSGVFLTAKQIAEKLGRDPERDIGSISGTLSVLVKDQWIKKNNDYPASFSYVQGDESPLHKSISGSYEKLYEPREASESPVETNEYVTRLRERLDLLDQEIEDLKTTLENLRITLEEKQKRRSSLKNAIDTLEREHLIYQD